MTKKKAHIGILPLHDRIKFKSGLTGMWYKGMNFAGDIDIACIELDGTIYYPSNNKKVKEVKS